MTAKTRAREAVEQAQALAEVVREATHWKFEMQCDFIEMATQLFIDFSSKVERETREATIRECAESYFWKHHTPGDQPVGHQCEHEKTRDEILSLLSKQDEKEGGK